jgi:hypothetical protein
MTPRLSGPLFVCLLVALADEAGLEGSLIDAAVAAIAGELQNCNR